MSLSQDSLFLPLQSFMVRTPILATDDFFVILNNCQTEEKILNFFDQTPVIAEAIQIASPSLYSSLKNRNNLSQKQHKQIAASLLKYISRMSTRPTPFGAFSFISLGNWSKTSDAHYQLSSVKKRVRPDVSWLTSVLANICESDGPLPSILIKVNPLIRDTGGRIHLSYYRNKKSRNPKESISIRKTPLIERILGLCRKPISMEALQKAVYESDNAIQAEKLQVLIRELLTKQILRLSIIPSLLSTTIFEDFLENLKEGFGEIEAFKLAKKFSEKINQYSKIPLGEGCAALQELFQEMNHFADCEVTPLQVDSYNSTDLVQVNDRIASDLAEGAEVLWKISYWKKDLSLLKEYHEKFLNKYGSSRLVPLKELVDEGVGLGLPPFNHKQDRTFREPPLPEQKYRSWIRKEYEECLHDQRQEIVFNPNFIDQLTKNIDKKEALLSLDITCEIIADSSEDVDNGHYLLFAQFLTSEGGSTYGRFLDMLGEKGIQVIRSLTQLEQSHEPNTLFSDISFMPYDIRGGNVCIHPNLRKYTIDLDNPSSKQGENISLEDILVGASEDRLFLTLRATGKELVVHAHHLYNQDLAPDIVQFLRLVSTERYSNITPFFWGELEQSSFLPRIRYKNIVLSAAQWHIDLDLLNAEKNSSHSDIKARFNAWAERWQMPAYLFLTVGDQRILLNRNEASHVNEIIDQIKKGNKVKLVEKLGQKKGNWVKSSRGSHQSEFTFTFAKNPKYARQPLFIDKKVEEEIPLKDRFKSPGSEWLYFKFYVSQDSQDYFISGIMPKFISHLLSQKVVDQFFYIRYTDPDHHLRIRFKGNPATLTSVLLPKMHQWAQTLIEERLLYRYELSTYDREIERYGGKELLEYAEKFFFYDSYCSIFLLKSLSDKVIQLPQTIVASLSIVNLLKTCGYNLEESIAFLSSSTSDKKELKGFREHKKKLLLFIKAIHDEEIDPEISTEIEALMQAFSTRDSSLQAFCSKMPHPGKDLSIVESLIHMHCNRFLGINNKMEKKARVYALHALKITNSLKHHLENQLTQADFHLE
jgi:lantibiotic biosynthesis protein